MPKRFILFYPDSRCRMPTHTLNQPNTQGREETVHVGLQWANGKGVGASGETYWSSLPPTNANDKPP